MWYVPAHLLRAKHPPYTGSFLDCLRRWDRLPAVDRATSFIHLENPVDGTDILRPEQLGKQVSAPEFLALR